MQKNNVRQIVRELARENFNMYPESYPILNGLATDEAIETDQEVGIAYFEHRAEHEVERDDKLNITQIDYVEWVMEEFSDWITNRIESMDLLTFEN